MKQTLKMTALTLAAGMLLTSCAGQAKEGREREQEDADGTETTYVAPEPQEAPDDLDAAYLNFAIPLFAECARNNGESGNMMISPASVFLALNMVAEGAEGDTLTEMRNVLMSGTDADAMARYAAAYNRRLNSSEGLTLHCANSMWINDSFADSVYDDFINNVTNDLSSEVSVIPFDGTAPELINSWVNENTDGMIPSIVDEIDPYGLMVLVNAISFEADWFNPFDDYQVTEEEFTTSSGERVSCTMLSESDVPIYYENDDAIGFGRPYDGGYSFVVMLPRDESVDINEFAASLTVEDYMGFMNSRTNEYDVYSCMPEFSSDYDVSLVPILQRMGMNIVFDPQNADLSGIASIDSSVSDVLHKTHIELDRYGTSAAAATAVCLRTAGISEEENIRRVYADRPFVYMIVEDDTSLPLFMGTVGDVR